MTYYICMKQTGNSVGFKTKDEALKFCETNKGWYYWGETTRGG